MTKIINSTPFAYGLTLLFVALSGVLSASLSLTIVLWGIYVVLILYFLLVEKTPIVVPAYIPALVTMTGGLTSPFAPLLFLMLPYAVVMGEAHFLSFSVTALATLMLEGTVQQPEHFYLYGVFVLSATGVYLYARRNRLFRFLAKNPPTEKPITSVSSGHGAVVTDPFLPLASYLSRMTVYNGIPISIRIVTVHSEDEASLFGKEQRFSLKGLVRRTVVDRVVSSCTTVLAEKEELPMDEKYSTRVYYPINLFEEDMHSSRPEYVILIDAGAGIERGKMATEFRSIKKDIVELLKMGETFSLILQERKNKERLYQGTKAILDAFERETLFRAGAWSLFTLEPFVSAILLTVRKGDSHKGYLYKQSLIGDSTILSLHSVTRSGNVGTLNDDSVLTALLNGKIGSSFYADDVTERKDDKKLFREAAFEELNRFDIAHSFRLVYNSESKGTLTLFFTRNHVKDHDKHTDSIRLLAQALAVAINNIEMYEKVEELSNVDGLTGLRNRRAFQETIDRMVAEASRTKQPLSLVMLDIDHFKRVNDTYGHKAGDDVIRFMARILKNSIRKVDIAARYGGEEFVLLLHNTSAEGAFELADKLRRNIHDSRVEADGEQLSVSSSFGVSAFPSLAKNSGDLVKTADTALYYSKENGRNRVTIYQEEFGEKPDE